VSDKVTSAIQQKFCGVGDMTSHPEATSGLLATAASVSNVCISNESTTSSVCAHDVGDDDGAGRKRGERRRRRGAARELP
jgi:hypothetical protein